LYSCCAPCNKDAWWGKARSSADALRSSRRSYAEVTLTSIREGMIVEILGRYQRLESHERHALLLAYDYTKDKLELEYGDFADWRDEDKTDVAHKLMEVAEEFIGGDPDWACGAGLLSLYVEAQTFPTDEAREMVLRIEDWHQNAIETEFGRLL
jgi:hypothetical protein